jgi:FkbM family methyltransferase
MFTQNWSGSLYNFLKNYKTPEQPQLCVEIGSFEGRGSIYIHDKLCGNPESRLICIDPWEDHYTLKKEFSDIDHFFKGQYNTFLNNTGHLPKIIPKRGYSYQVIQTLENNTVDFVFIDGDHSPEGVYTDAKLMFPKIKKEGVILFDDYNWTHNGLKCGDGIDRFILEFKDNIEIIFKGDYVYLKKIRDKPEDKPEDNIIFDVYVLNWNEERLLPFLFKHYSQARNIYVIDNMSTDSSKTIIEKNGGIVIPFDTNNTLSDDANRDMKNTQWKKYSMDCDFVVVSDLDEFLYFPDQPDLIKAMNNLKIKGKTCVKPAGYTIFFSDQEWDRVNKEQSLISQTIHGMRDVNYDKPILFSPKYIGETNFSLGSHSWDAKGELNIDSSPIILHYKYIGKQYTIERYKAISKRLSENNKKNGWGVHYNKPEKELEEYVNGLFLKGLETNIFRTIFPSSITAECIFKGKRYVLYTHGYSDIISKSVLDKNIWEPKVASYIYSFFRNKTDTVFIDIGANIGTHTCIAKISGAEQIYAIECYKPNIELLKNTVSINGWENIDIIPYGVSDTEKEYDFNIDNTNIGASHINDTHIGGWNVNSKEKIYCKTFESLVDCEKIKNKNILINIDVEGHEKNVLLSMKNILEKENVNLSIELNAGTSSLENLTEIVDILKNYFPKYFTIMNIPEDNWFGEEKEYTIDNRDIFEFLKNKNTLQVVFQK